MRKRPRKWELAANHGSFTGAAYGAGASTRFVTLFSTNSLSRGDCVLASASACPNLLAFGDPPVDPNLPLQRILAAQEIHRLDSDSDSWANWTEALHGTDPFDPASSPPAGQPPAEICPAPPVP